MNYKCDTGEESERVAFILINHLFCFGSLTSQTDVWSAETVSDSSDIWTSQSEPPVSQRLQLSCTTVMGVYLTSLHSYWFHFKSPINALFVRRFSLGCGQRNFFFFFFKNVHRCVKAASEGAIESTRKTWYSRFNAVNSPNTHTEDRVSWCLSVSVSDN